MYVGIRMQQTNHDSIGQHYTGVHPIQFAGYTPTFIPQP